jgi:hypothetical protein
MKKIAKTPSILELLAISPHLIGTLIILRAKMAFFLDFGHIT